MLAESKQMAESMDQVAANIDIEAGTLLDPVVSETEELGARWVRLASGTYVESGGGWERVDSARLEELHSEVEEWREEPIAGDREATTAWEALSDAVLEGRVPCEDV